MRSNWVRSKVFGGTHLSHAFVFSIVQERSKKNITGTKNPGGFGVKYYQARSQKFAMGGGCLGGWGLRPPRLKILHFFAKITSF